MYIYKYSVRKGWGRRALRLDITQDGPISIWRARKTECVKKIFLAFRKCQRHYCLKRFFLKISETQYWITPSTAIEVSCIYNLWLSGFPGGTSCTTCNHETNLLAPHILLRVGISLKFQTSVHAWPFRVNGACQGGLRLLLHYGISVTHRKFQHWHKYYLNCNVLSQNTLIFTGSHILY